MKLPLISIEKIIRDTCPGIRLGCLLSKVEVQHGKVDSRFTFQQRCLLSKVEVQPAVPGLKHFIEKELAIIQAGQALQNIHDLPPLAATRTAYKALGKDPSRYRPSAEALLRRVVQGKGLYTVNNVVDALNLISVKTGFSIGGYDVEQIQGEIRLGRGGRTL